MSARARPVLLPEIGVSIRDGQVWAGQDCLGPLAGARAWVTRGDAPGFATMLRAVLGNANPRVGSIVVTVASGERTEIPLYQGTRAQVERLEAAVAEFNALAGRA